MGGTHFTLNELNTVKKNDNLVLPQKINEIKPLYSNKKEYKKSYYTTKNNIGEFKDLSNLLVDDFLNNKEEAKLYTHLK